MGETERIQRVAEALDVELVNQGAVLAPFDSHRLARAALAVVDGEDELPITMTAEQIDVLDGSSGGEQLTDLEAAILLGEMPQHAWSGSSPFEDDDSDWFALDAVRKAALAKLRRLANGVEAECDHEWVNVVNKAVVSGEMCRKCHAIRSGVEAEGEQQT